MLFPLPLTPFERYMFLDDRVDYPMNMFCRLRFRGSLDVDRMYGMRDMILGRHPLSRAIIEKDRRGRLVWVDAGDATRLLRCELRPDGSFPAVDRIDLTKEPGLRAWTAVGRDESGEETSEVTFQIHHAFADGVGALQIAHDFLLSYHAMVTGAPPEKRVLRTYQPELLRQRMSMGLTFWKLMAILPQQSVGLAGIRQFFTRKPVPLGRDFEAPDDEAPPQFPSALTFDLTIEETERYADAALRSGGTVNDLLVADVFATAADWQKRFGLESKQWLRMMTPFNLRQYADRRLPAANVVSMVFLDRTPEQIADDAGLLRSLREEISLIQRLNLGLTFPLVLGGMARLPGGIGMMTKKSECKSSCILTNLGEPFAKLRLPREESGIRVGDVTLKGFDLVAPIRPLTRLALTAFRFEGRQALNLHWDARSVKREEAVAFLEECFRRMRARLAGDASAASPVSDEARAAALSAEPI
ncbi:MAG TPA: hypothetical protein VGN57_21755 [Pirellulaceae bacterium]|jgi:hypothetical protein|nr:hypothetical protein [Pirellulaceae bacterium]